MIGFFVIPCLLSVIAVLKTVVAPARKERFKAAKQFQTFDVRNTQAFSPPDKDYVLVKISEWYSGDDLALDVALDAFNQVCACLLIPARPMA